MTIDEVEALIKTKTRSKVRIHHLEEHVGDSVAFLSYSIDDNNQMTIWHTEVPPSLQHMGIGGKLGEESVQLASSDSSSPRRVPVREGIFRPSSRTAESSNHGKRAQLSIATSICMAFGTRLPF